MPLGPFCTPPPPSHRVRCPSAHKRLRGSRSNIRQTQIIVWSPLICRNKATVGWFLEWLIDVEPIFPSRSVRNWKYGFFSCLEKLESVGRVKKKKYMSMSQPLGSKHKTGKEPLKCYIVRPVQSILFCFLFNFENDFLYRLFQKCQNHFPREVLDILIGEPFLCGQQSLRYGREAKVKKMQLDVEMSPPAFC